MGKKVLMMLACLMLLAAAAAFGDEAAAPSRPEAPYVKTLDEAMALATKEDRPIAIKFYTDWCTWCKRLDTVVLVDQKAIDFFSHEMVLAKINAEVDTNIAKTYKVSGYPTTVMVDKNGKEIDRIVGYMEVDDFVGTLRNYGQGKGTLDDLLHQAKGSTDRKLMFEIADKYKYRGGETEATEWYNKVIAADAKDSLAGESRMAIADMLRRAKKFDEALAAFGGILVDFPNTSFAEGATIYTAIVQARKGDTTSAIATYEKFIATYPKSEDVDYAKKQIDKLKNPGKQAGS